MSDNINLSEFIKQSFGSNATYVEGLLERYRSDPKLVDESWQTFFGDLLTGKAPDLETNGTAAAQQAETRAVASVFEGIGSEVK